MQCRWTNHALMEASRRGIAMQDVDLVLLLPGQILAVRPGRQVWQSVLTSGYLLRVFVDYRPPAVRNCDGVPHQQSREVLEHRAMKVLFDPETDTLSVVITEGIPVESEEPKPGIILDYDASGTLVSLEILDASKRMPIPQSVDVEVATRNVG